MPVVIDKPALFEDLGYTPHDGQLPVHESTAARRVLACGVRWGKTQCAAAEAMAAAMEPAKRSCGWIVAPNYELADKVYREIVYYALEKLPAYVVKHREHDRMLKLRNIGGGVSEIRAKSGDNPVSLLGEGLDWLVVDEAARLKPQIWDSHLSQRLIDRDGWALLISTPKGKGWFYDLWRMGNSGDNADYESWNKPSWTNPYLNEKLIERERGRLPDRVFAQEYGADFVEGAGAVFRNIRELATGDWQEPIAGQQYFAGLDLAKVEDYTVLCVLNYDRELVFVDRFHRIDWNLQIPRIQATLKKYNDATVMVDSTGAGEPVFEALVEAGCYASGYKFTAPTKTKLINNLAMMLENRQIRLPKSELWPVGIDELEAFEYSVTDAGNVRQGAPPGLHDDTVIALALAAMNCGPKAEFRVDFV